MKTCTKCGVKKSEAAFSPDKTKKGGLKSSCKACRVDADHAWRVANPGKAKAKDVAYYAANSEKVKAKRLAYYAANTNKQKDYSAVYRAENPDKAKASCAAWRAANPGKLKAKIAIWRAANPESLRIYSANRRARKRKCGGVLSKGLSDKLFSLQKGRCACCGNPLGEKYHLDHIMPLARGGANTDSNMQLLINTCNMQKHASDPLHFMRARGYLL